MKYDEAVNDQTAKNNNDDKHEHLQRRVIFYFFKTKYSRNEKYHSDEQGNARIDKNVLFRES